MLHPTFDFVEIFCAPALTEREEKYMLLLRSINSIIKAWEGGDYGTVQEGLRNIEAWRMECKKAGVEL